MARAMTGLTANERVIAGSVVVLAAVVLAIAAPYRPVFLAYGWWRALPGPYLPSGSADPWRLPRSWLALAGTLPSTAS